ncbi:uncharacterized protein A4U43_C03F15950 [Asparagus officinalis]|uniref:DUF629 domain-containing protein n=1 Tax=Asparagus officinalis TaxID=4686 RepID=A0A5P1FC77_ASPOF|nr:uncharacterized protein LOC109833798 [Asparagus officinalis]ONK75353.1 uncharacterized protein A4U43_C03F15950 [Asparagus officinalis]
MFKSPIKMKIPALIIPPSSSLAPTITEPHPSLNEMKNLCRALQFIRKGDPVKAKNVLKGIRHKHQSSAVFHRVHSAVLCHYATKLINDPESQTYQYDNALDSAHQATILSPNNLEFSFYYVTRLVSHCKYEEAKKECERALAITNPVDFLMDYIKESNQETSTLERISLHQDYLQFLLYVLKSPNLSEKCRKTLLIDPGIVQIRTYLRSLQTPTEWRDLLRVPIKDFEYKTDFKFPFEALTFSHEKHIWKYWVCPCCDEQDFNDAQLMWQHMLEEHLYEPPEELQSFLPKQLDQHWTDKIVKGIWEPIDIRDRTTNSNLECSLSTNTERSFFLKRIKCNFWLLATNNCLSKSHIDKVLRYVMGENQVLPSVQDLENVGTGDQLILCIRILDSLQLEKVHNFLESLVQACNLCIRAERHRPLGNAFLDSPGIGVTLDDSFLHIDLDLKPLSNSENSLSAEDKTWSSPDVNRVMCWLYEDQNHTEKINALAAEREVETINIVEKLRNEYEDLCMICSKKRKLIQYQDALNLFKNKCKNELAERANSAEYLTQWKKELAEKAESGNDSLICVISDILTEAETLNASRKQDGAINQSNDNDKDNSTSSLDNSCIKAAHKKLESSSNVEICIADAQIMKNLATTRQLQLNLERDCTVDYRVILVPHLRAYIQEALKRRIAEQKESGAKIEASFKELLHDDEKQTVKRDYNRKQLQETARGKTKSSSFKKSKRKQSR